jgi:hypothetical protein
MAQCISRILRASIISTALCTASAAAFADPPDNAYSLGVEGFHDRYREPQDDATLRSGYGSITGGYTHNWDSIFGAIDGRASYGRATFSAPGAGDVGTMPQWEYELRARGGVSLPFADGTLSPYIGIGARDYNDEEKGTTTSLGVPGYDTRVWQFYIPVGATYAYATPGGWTFTPTLEYDQFLYGTLDSRLQNIPGGGYSETTNTQNEGFGVRGECMVGRKEPGFAWEAGPFLRYWNIRGSDSVGAAQLMTPPNERVQTGLALRITW